MKHLQIEIGQGKYSLELQKAFLQYRVENLHKSEMTVVDLQRVLCQFCLFMKYILGWFFGGFLI